MGSESERIEIQSVTVTAQVRRIGGVSKDTTLKPGEQLDWAEELEKNLKAEQKNVSLGTYPFGLDVEILGDHRMLCFRAPSDRSQPRKTGDITAETIIGLCHHLSGREKAMVVRAITVTDQIGQGAGRVLTRPAPSGKPAPRERSKSKTRKQAPKGPKTVKNELKSDDERKACKALGGFRRDFFAICKDAGLDTDTTKWSEEDSKNPKGIRALAFQEKVKTFTQRVNDLRAARGVLPLGSGKDDDGDEDISDAAEGGAKPSYAETADPSYIPDNYVPGSSSRGKSTRGRGGSSKPGPEGKPKGGDNPPPFKGNRGSRRGGRGGGSSSTPAT